MTETVLIDSNAFNPLSGAEELALVSAARADGRVRLVTTPSVLEEVRADPDAARRSLHLAVDPEVVHEVAVYGVARYGSSKFASPEDGEAYQTVATSEPHRIDGVAVATAKSIGAAIVTADGRMQRRASEAGCRWVTNEEFVSWVRAGADKALTNGGGDAPST